MQKFPEASDRKKGRRMRKKRDPPDKKRKLFSLFSSDRGINNISISRLLVEANVAALKRHVGLTFH